MRISFYAPLKPPDHPVASGDRAMARALISALRICGHEVAVPSVFRAFDGGTADRQERLRTVGLRLADRIVRRFSAGPKPDLWFTYHLYHNAPHWLGPTVTHALRIPYVPA